MTAWCNGQLWTASAVRIDPSDRGFLLGDGVFETVRIHRGRPRHLDRHLVRLRQGAAMLGIPLRFGDGALRDAIGAMLFADVLEDGALRITLSRGAAPRGLATPAAMTPTLLITAHAGSPPTGAVRLVTARSTRRNEHSPLSRIKSLSYLDNIIARREAEAAGADDALMLNTAGRVADSTVANVLVLLDDHLWTPPVADGALPGIARGRLLADGLASECPIDPDRLSAAKTLFLCNSLGVRPASALDGRGLMREPDLLQTLSTALLSGP